MADLKAAVKTLQQKQAERLAKTATPTTPAPKAAPVSAAPKVTTPTPAPKPAAPTSQDIASKGGLVPTTAEQQFTGSYIKSPAKTPATVVTNKENTATGEVTSKETTIAPTDETLKDEALNKANGETTTVVPPSFDSKKYEEDTTGAFDDYKKELGALKDTYKASQDALVKAAEDKYNAEITALDNFQALQQDLASRQNVLIEGSSDIQKQEAKNAYEANQAALELQKTKVAQAYENMVEQQDLLNKQRKIREETALGLIYGGFGSLAANKNIEETIMRGEGEIQKIKKDAINEDTEISNELVELNKSYELDVRKIEQWKAQEQVAVYAKLQEYITEVKNNKLMANVEKEAAVSSAINEYKNKIAEINANTAQLRYDLAIGVINKTEEMKQIGFENQITADAANRTAETYRLEKATNKFNQLVATYGVTDYKDLTPELKAEFEQIEKDLEMPKGYIEKTMGQLKIEAENKPEPGWETKFFTNSRTGEVTAVRYNSGTGKYETQSIGAITKATGGGGGGDYYGTTPPVANKEYGGSFLRNALGALLPAPVNNAISTIAEQLGFVPLDQVQAPESNWAGRATNSNVVERDDGTYLIQYDKVGNVRSKKIDSVPADSKDDSSDDDSDDDFDGS